MKNSTRKIFISIILFWSLSPLIWQIYTSFSTPASLTEPIGTTLNRWTLDNYIQVLSANPSIFRYITNSTLLGVYTTLTTLLLAVPASYALIKLRKELRSLTRSILLLTALFPYVLLFLALLELAKSYNLANNLFLLSLPYSALSMPLAILILSSSLNDIPIELEEAAKMEGLNLLQRLRVVLLPLMKPALSSTSILVFIFSWNEYPIALTWLSKTEQLTLPVAIARLAGSSVYSVPYGAYAAATVIGAIPLLMVTLVFQKQIVNGLTQGALKG